MSENLKNELMKRKYFSYLKDARGQAEASIRMAEGAILRYEEFAHKEDFGRFNIEKAKAFKKWLLATKLALASKASCLRQLSNFFVWLAGQSGYKSKVSYTDIEYLKLSNAEERLINNPAPRNFPPLEYVLKLVDSIKPKAEVDLRDRALIAFACLTGMRDSAIASLPMGCFDENKLMVNQAPACGVKTKFTKQINSRVFRFADGLLKSVLDWQKHLKGRGFGAADPLFPRSKQEQGKDTISFEAATAVEARFWHGAGRIREIFKRRASAAGLPYFPPHTYRHLAVTLALKKAKSGEEIKAISQNFGHEHVPTTLSVYGNYQPDQLAETLQKIDDRVDLLAPDSDVETLLQKALSQLREKA